MSDQDSKDSFVQRWIEQQHQLGQGVDISIVIPAYNEERRLPPTLIDTIDYFDASGQGYEIIVVDDGSSDQTSRVVQKFQKIRTQVKLIRLPRNYGKGHAVRTGMLNAVGKAVLFADADGSTPIAEYERVRKTLDQGADVAIGSRALRSQETSISTRWYRKLMGRTFNFFVNSFLLPGFADTQCGFKLFTSEAARFVFENQQSDQFSFDIEILLIARKVGLRVEEVPINWTNVPGSKVNLVVDSLKMFRDIFVFRVRHRKLSRADYERFRDLRSAAQTA